MAVSLSKLLLSLVLLADLGSCDLHVDKDVHLSLFQKRAQAVSIPTPGTSDAVGAQALEAPPPTLPPVISATDVPTNAAQATGVTENAAEDLDIFISAIIVNSVSILVFVSIFMYLRQHYPLTFHNNVLIGTAPKKALGDNPEEAIKEKWGWWKASMETDTEETVESVGLDNAMLIEFTKLGMRLFTYIGVPMFCIIGPINCALGGHPAWDKGDYLSSLSFGNVENGSQLYWMHAIVVWYVVITIRNCIFSAQRAFLELRFNWLAGMASIRANTIMVEGIPETHRSDAKLKEFFASVFTKDTIKSTYITKDTSDLLVHVKRRDTANAGLEEANATWDKAGKEQDKRPTSMMHGDLIDYYTKEVNEANEQIKIDQAKLKNEASELGGVNLWTGFVTFTDRKYAQMAKNQLYSEDHDEWVVTCPPEPNDILWGDMMQNPERAGLWTAIGYGAVIGLYFAYMPLVLGISKLAASVDLGPLQSVWAALAPTMGLQIMVGFLPTFLLLIFRSCFTLNADAYAQKRLQTWYFWFQIVFVVLVTAIGDSVVEFTKTVLFDPLAVPALLGATMPGATHFYMNFLVLQWVTHAMGMMRHVMLGKFKAFSMLFDEETARKKSEPEDQDYYGLGSRNARFTINMVIGIVYGTLSPPINVLSWVEFALCRLFYGYLIPFAEIRKPDLGGVFWVACLKHLFVGTIIYCVVMIGVISGRAEMSGFTPTCIVAPSLIYVVMSMRRFENAFNWEELPITKVAAPPKGLKIRELHGAYVQPELSTN